MATARKSPKKSKATKRPQKTRRPAPVKRPATRKAVRAAKLRKLYEKADGYSASASKTFGAALDRVYGAWNDPQQRAQWLMDAPIEVRRSTDGKSRRITWTAGSSDIEVGFYKSGAGKTRVQL